MDALILQKFFRQKITMSKNTCYLTEQDYARLIHAPDVKCTRSKNYYTYEPKDKTIFDTALILMHGGSFYFGCKGDMHPICMNLAQHFVDSNVSNYKIYNVGYPLGDYAWPDPLRALIETINQIPEQNIVLGGCSAGAFYALQLYGFQTGQFEEDNLNIGTLTRPFKSLILLSPFIDSLNVVLNEGRLSDISYSLMMGSFANMGKLAQYNPMDLSIDVPILCIDGSDLSFVPQCLKFAALNPATILHLYYGKIHGFMVGEEDRLIQKALSIDMESFLTGSSRTLDR